MAVVDVSSTSRKGASKFPAHPQAPTCPPHPPRDTPAILTGRRLSFDKVVFNQPQPPEKMSSGVQTSEHWPSEPLPHRAPPSDKMPPAREKADAEMYLKSLLNKTLRVHTKDSRMFIGTFKCTDPVRPCSLALSVCTNTLFIETAS